MTSVKLTFEKSKDGGKISIEKVGDKFTLDEISKVTNTLEAMFAGAMSESEPGVTDEEEDVEDVDEEEVDKMAENEAIKEEAEAEVKYIDESRKTKDGTIDQRQLNRGQGRAGGNKVRKDGAVDRRTTRAERTPEELKNEPFIKRLHDSTTDKA